MATTDIDALLAQAASDDDARDELAKALSRKKTREAIADIGRDAAPGLIAVVDGSSVKKARERAAALIATTGADPELATPALVELAGGSDKAGRRAALDALLAIGAPREACQEVAMASLAKGDPEAIALIGSWGVDAVEELRDLLDEDVGTRKRKPAAQALVEIADQLQGAEVEDEVLALLEADNDSLKQLGLEVVARLRRPPASLAEPVADVSSMPGAKRALLSFEREHVMGELRSLIASNNVDERIVGMEIVQQYGASAEDYIELISDVLANDKSARGATVAVHTLAKLLPEAQLAEALEPTLDHWSEEVRDVAGSYLQAADIPVRESVWEGHPFSDSLLFQFQRLGVRPRDTMEIPDDRPFPFGRPVVWTEEGEEDIRPEQLSPAMWALLNMLVYPDTMFTVWDSYDEYSGSAPTFYFSGPDSDMVFTEGDAIFDVHATGQRRLMHVVGNGSIGYYATVDLLDVSDDPPIYYIERWGRGWSSSAWRVSWSLSQYLRSLGTR